MAPKAAAAGAAVLGAFGLALLLTSLAQQRDGERGTPVEPARNVGVLETGRSEPRTIDPARVRDTGRSRDRANVPLYIRDFDQLREETIYGADLMTDLELSQYRERLRLLRDDGAWARMQMRHQEDMRGRAERRGEALPPPVYGQHFMTSREQAQYRQQLAEAASEHERAEMRALHISAMQARARQIGEPLPQPFYGQPLMSDRERERLAERLRAAPTERERDVIRNEHRRAIQERAREYGVPFDLLEPPETGSTSWR